MTSAVMLLLLVPSARPLQTLDGGWYYLPATHPGRPAPALVVLSCVGGGRADLDSICWVADSLGWVFAVCRGPRNRREFRLNDADLLQTASALRRLSVVDSERVFVFGFSGMGVQALTSMCLHPDIFRGVAATCAHRGAITGADLGGCYANKVFLRTRQTDWNRQDNLRLYYELNAAGIETRLVVDSGGHVPGPAAEILQACRWLDMVTSRQREIRDRRH